ncbi:MAG: hypothetical protein BGO32_08745 [Bacteroidetes bacterium 37-13]|nr:MAG: hypothetical protein BGO32_08745 [Bacteroidetes bacterium 37-13]
MPITIQKQTNKQLHVLLSQSGSMAHKAELVNGFTSGRTEHSSEMFEFEAINMIKWLKEQNQEPRSKSQEPPSDVANRMRKKILAICHTMAWYKRDDNKELILKGGKPQLDFARINAFCTTRCPGKKPLQKYSLTELPAIVTIFERLLKSDLS